MGRVAAQRVTDDMMTGSRKWIAFCWHRAYMQFERVLRALLMWQLIESQHIMQLIEKQDRKGAGDNYPSLSLSI
jgi:hypothetical protein